MVKSAVEKTYDIKFDDLNCLVSAKITADKLRAEHTKRLAELTRNIKLPGFRPGKIPKALITQRYGNAVLTEAAESLVQSGFDEIIKAEDIELASQPKLTMKTVALGEEVAYEVSFESMPKIPEIDYNTLKKELPVIELTDQDLESIAQEQIKQKPSWAEKKGKIKKGDRVKVDFDGTIENEPFEGGAGKDIEISIGEGRFLQDFEAGIVGAKAGETLDIEVTFPEAYHQKSLAQKQAQFKVTVNSVQEPKYAKLDKKWFELCGSKAKDKQEFLEELRKKEQIQVNRMADRIASNYISDSLSDQLKFSVPKTLLDQELQVTNSEDTQDKEQKVAKAQAHIRYVLQIKKIAKDQKIDVSGKEVEQYIESLIPTGVDVNFFKSWYAQDRQRIEKIQMAVLEEKAVNFVKQACELKTIKMSLAEAKSILDKEN